MLRVRLVALWNAMGFAQLAPLKADSRPDDLPPLFAYALVGCNLRTRLRILLSGKLHVGCTISTNAKYDEMRSSFALAILPPDFRIPR